jgi:hypothetical protein
MRAILFAAMIFAGPVSASVYDGKVDWSIPSRQATSSDVVQFILEITSGWSHTASTEKSESAKEVFLCDPSGANSEAFFRAIKDLNEVFGYEKLKGSLSGSMAVQEGQIGVYVVPYLQARHLMISHYCPQPTFNGPVDVRIWDNSAHQISRAIVLLASDRLKPGEFDFRLRRMLLSALGYGGYSTRVMDSIFYAGAPCASTMPATAGCMAEMDRAVLQFCDRYIPADSSRADRVTALKQAWQTFLSNRSKTASAAK